METEKIALRKKLFLKLYKKTISTYFKCWKDNSTFNLSINITTGTIFST